MAASPSLDRLPHEILLEITGHLSPQNGVASPMQKQYGIYPTLSLVNRRLHDFAGHLVFREIRVSNPLSFGEVPHFLVSNSAVRDSVSKNKHLFPSPESEELIPYSRTIRVGCVDTHVWTPWAAHMLQSFSNLQGFHCLFECDNEGLRSLSSLSRLHTITLAWRRSCPFPSLADLKELKVLRIFLSLGTSQHSQPLQRPSHSLLTTLSIEKTGDWLDDMMDSVTQDPLFPNLRVLNVQDLQDQSTRPFLLYHFIHVHATLLEVNVSFEVLQRRLLLPLVKLIDGTGRWRAPTGSCPSSHLDNPVSVSADMEPWMNLGLDAFAFCRYPIANALLDAPKYRVTSFAVRTDDRDPGWQNLSHSEILLQLGENPLFEETEYLSISTSSINLLETVTFETYFVSPSPTMRYHNFERQT
jgi:hypothetical protein